MSQSKSDSRASIVAAAEVEFPEATSFEQETSTFKIRMSYLPASFILYPTDYHVYVNEYKTILLPPI